MNKTEAFKNDLRNYLYDKNSLIKIKFDINNINKINKEKNSDEKQYKKFSILKDYSKKLIMLEQDMEQTYNELKGVKAIRYDKVPLHSSNQSQIEQRRLNLIEIYHNKKKLFKEELNKTEKYLYTEYDYFSKKVNRTESALVKLPKDIRNICLEIYCGDKTYQNIIKDGDVYYTDAGLFKKIEKELDNILS